MDITKKNNEPLNRRRAFRIYEKADIFYQKVSSSPSNEASLDFSEHIADIDDTGKTEPIELPKSNSQDNNTLNVNISSSGVSFTCKEQLQQGDYLVLRVLLLSSMMVITVSCKVVYCVDSNPFENDRLPYLVGVSFINIRPEDTQLLSKHIHKKKQQSFISKGLLASLFIFTLIAPDIVIDSIIGLLDLIFESVSELLYIIYEVISLNLDNTIEHLLHTTLHTAQVISFYLSLTVGALAGYFMLRPLPGKFIKMTRDLQGFFYRKKSSFSYYWHEKSFFYKFNIISAITISSTCYVMFFI